MLTCEKHVMIPVDPFGMSGVFKVGGEFKFIPWILKTFIVCVHLRLVSKNPALQRRILVGSRDIQQQNTHF